MSKVRALKANIKCVFLDLKFRWLHDPSIIQRLVCKQVRREEKGDSESLVYGIDHWLL